MTSLLVSGRSGGGTDRSSTNSATGACTAAAAVAAAALAVTTATISYSCYRHWKNAREPKPWKILPGWRPIAGHAHKIPDGFEFAHTLEAWAAKHQQRRQQERSKGGEGHVVEEKKCDDPTVDETKGANGGDDDDEDDVGCYEIDLGGTRMVVIYNEQRALEVLQHRPYTVRRLPAIVRAFDSIVPNGILSAEGDLWKQQHKFVAAALNHKSVNDYMHVFRQMSQRLLHKWARLSDDPTSPFVRINEDLGSVSGDTVSVVGMGRDYDFLNYRQNENRGSSSGGTGTSMSSDVRTAGNAVGRRFLFSDSLPYWKVPIVGQYLDGRGFAIRRITKAIERIIVDEEQQQGEQKQTEKGDSSSDSLSQDGKTKKQETFLRKILAMASSEGGTKSSPSSSSSWVTRERLVGNVLTLFLAGTDTTSQALTNALYALGSDAQLQEELRSEVDDYFLKQQRRAEELTGVRDMYETFPRIKSFLHEVHRFYGLPIMGLYVAEDAPQCDDGIPFCNGAVRLKKGTSVTVLNRYISTTSPNTPRGPDGAPPREFCPRRWLAIDGETGKISCPSPSNKSAWFLPFGYGVRSCPGRAYSEILSYTILIDLLRTFTWTLRPDHPVPRILNDITVDDTYFQVDLVLQKR